VFAAVNASRVPTQWVEAGAAVTLNMVTYRPLVSRFGAGPYPTLVFHHGSTGNGDNAALFPLVFTNETIAQGFTERGWMVVFPQRRGRGGSGGTYDEGFTADRSRYSCEQVPALAGLDRALADADVITDFVRALPDADATRLLIAGQSRGGILSAAHAARRPLVYRAAINFVGGWLGELCVDAVPVNRGTFVAAAAGPRSVLWLYGENDPFYGATHSRANFDAFAAAGGKGSYKLYRRSNPANSGHLIINEPALWQADLEAFVLGALQ
jgi:dienelactone hydrolase